MPLMFTELCPKIDKRRKQDKKNTKTRRSKPGKESKRKIKKKTKAGMNVVCLAKYPILRVLAAH